MSKFKTLTKVRAINSYEFVKLVAKENFYPSKFSKSSFLAFFFSKVRTKAGKTNKLENIAKAKVQEINPPRAIVPLKLERVKVAKPNIKTTEV